MREFVSKSEEETWKIAEDFAGKISLEGRLQGRAKVIGLYGELGAGKTSFMKGVAKYFGINETIQSPTFVIEKIYELSSTNYPPASNCEASRAGNLPTTIFSHLIHIDAYRIEKSNEMLNLGWSEIISDPHNLIFIEWPERIADIMPEHTKIMFEHISPNEKKLE